MSPSGRAASQRIPRSSSHHDDFIPPTCPREARSSFRLEAKFQRAELLFIKHDFSGSVQVTDLVSRNGNRGSLNWA